MFGSPIWEKPLASAPTNAEFLNAALQFLRRHVGVLQRQRGQRLKAVGPLAHLFGE